MVASALAIFPQNAGAAWLTLAPPVEVPGGWTRIVGRYADAGPAPRFRATARCGHGDADVHVLDRVVYARSEDGALWLDLRGTPDRLEPLDTPCDAPELRMEMLVDGKVVASAPVARREVPGRGLSAAVLAPPQEPARPTGRFRIGGQKYGAPSGKRTEAGVSWFLDSRVSIQLNYQRTSQPPMMTFDHDDGILTRLRVGF